MLIVHTVRTMHNLNTVRTVHRAVRWRSGKGTTLQTGRSRVRLSLLNA
jgi:hypothetical protein